MTELKELPAMEILKSLIEERKKTDKAINKIFKRGFVSKTDPLQMTLVLYSDEFKHVVKLFQADGLREKPEVQND